MLNVENLTLHYRTRRGIVRAVDGVSFTIGKGETMALVGESGCGKSSTANAIMRLLPRNVASFSGKIDLDGEDLMKLQDHEFSRRIAWKRISMVFQGAMNSLNPVLRVGYQVAEPLIIHEGFDRRGALKKVMEVMELVRLPSSIIDRYPHELSGGMKQRVIIAMALIMGPSLVILDEPTSALDVITQANIMNTLKDLKKSLGIAYIFITHDLALASELADKIAVMYGGKIVEQGRADDILKDPRHPYTEGLIASVPTLRTDKNLEFIPGVPPDLINPPTGCLFHPRCQLIQDICKQKSPAPVDEGGERRILCWLYARN